MSRPPRGLSPEEAALWARLAATVQPLRKPASSPPVASQPATVAQPEPAPANTPKPPPQLVKPARRAKIASSPAPTPPPPPPEGNLDSHWERRLARAAMVPDITLDLHDHTLDAAHARLDAGLAQARAMGARLVLVITGRPRPVEAADRASRRGAIRAHVLDWLAAGPHAGAIAAVRPAHRRHGGEGALYLVLRRKR